MTLRKSLDLNQHDSLFEWVSAASEETNIDEEAIWNIAEKLLLEPESMEEIETELRLKVLYELHLNRWTNTDDNPPASWVKINFSSESEVNQFRFSFGMFDAPLPDGDEQVETMKRITREEGIEVQHNDPDHIVTRNCDCDPVWAVRITKRILEEVYEASMGEVEDVEEEVTWSDNLTWEDVAEFR